MTHVIVNDASCLIDLHKGQLLHVVLNLPYRFVVPFPVRHSELLDLTVQEWRFLDDAGLETFDVPQNQMPEAFALKSRYPKLSANDCICLVTTQCHENGILLTGDGLLRQVAGEVSVRVHGVLWIIDELRTANVCSSDILISALETWRDDPSVFLPSAEIEQRLRHLKSRT